MKVLKKAACGQRQCYFYGPANFHCGLVGGPKMSPLCFLPITHFTPRPPLNNSASYVSPPVRGGPSPSINEQHEEKCSVPWFFLGQEVPVILRLSSPLGARWWRSTQGLLWVLGKGSKYPQCLPVPEGVSGTQVWTHSDCCKLLLFCMS